MGILPYDQVPVQGSLVVDSSSFPKEILEKMISSAGTGVFEIAIPIAYVYHGVSIESGSEDMKIKFFFTAMDINIKAVSD